MLRRRTAGDDTSDEAEVASKERTRRRQIGQRVALVALSLVGGAVLMVVGFNLYLQFAEWRDPSGRVFVEIGGERVYLEQPTAVVTPPGLPTAAADVATPAPGLASTPDAAPTATVTARSEDDVPADGVPTARTDVPLPPVRIEIASIALDVPVLLVTSDDMPRQPFAGWFFRSAFPATAGNTVIVGHLDGNAAIFGRLHELAPGDQVRVYTQSKVHIYVVDGMESVDPHAVEAIAPTRDATLTLLTCAGDWNPLTRSYDQRLVVRAYYAAVEELPAG